jgi:dCMP deaminase
MDDWVKPRKVPSRDEKYMGLALYHASFSKDPATQIGCVITDGENGIAGTGYNGPPAKIDDGSIDWGRPSKYEIMVHAEENAIDFAKGKLTNCTLYVTGLPCLRCLIKIIRHKIPRVCYLDRLYDGESSQACEEQKRRVTHWAYRGEVDLFPFKGDLEWLDRWNSFLKESGLLRRWPTLPDFPTSST